MSRAIRNETKDLIEAAHDGQPYALGPLLGFFAVKVNVSPPVVATMLDTHEQTVTRWMRGRAGVRASLSLPVARLIAFFAWMIETEWEPLHGTLEERKKQLAAAGKVYAELAGIKQKRSAKR